MFHPVSFTAEVVIKAERDGEQRRNVIHYRYSGTTPDAGELAALCATIEGSIIDHQEDLVCLGTRFYEISATDIHAPGGATAARSINRFGSGGTQVLPANSSLCLTKRTSLSGKSYRGRFYLFDMPEDFLNGSTLNPAWIPGTTTLANDLLSRITVGSRIFSPAVASKKLAVSTPMTSVSFDLNADSQRRRLPGRGS